MSELIQLESNPSIEPGHQWLKIAPTQAGKALVRLLTGQDDIYEFFVPDLNVYAVPHDHVVDQNMVSVINELAHVRFSAPDLVQLTLVMTTVPTGGAPS
jgi:hypothetical protein